MTCEICGEPITSEDWDNDNVTVLNPERALSFVVDTRASHKECETGKNFITQAAELIMLEKELNRSRIQYLKAVIRYKEKMTEDQFKSMANTRAMLIALDEDYNYEKELVEQLNIQFESYT